MAKSLLQQIREAHKELLVEGLEKAANGVSASEKGGVGGGEAVALSGTADATATSGGGVFGLGGGTSASSASQSLTSLLEADALALVPLFADHAGEMSDCFSSRVGFARERSVKRRGDGCVMTSYSRGFEMLYLSVFSSGRYNCCQVSSSFLLGDERVIEGWACGF